ncbi:uncharacterized protein A4U43_C10F1620 [Asparagus officinalis]|uniref:non-specific serine/threonine protein kinase n=1 Tax=Asparagus officinalis TaxID=4686 RepID=A0A5P1DZU2_ASPOF|nr:uncharacterized protein A4U43_C10F1620 [Asparagus officinalis]
MPASPCDVYSACGAYGICDQSRKPPCTCPHGFTPTSVRDWELDGWNSGCKRKTQLECSYKDSTSGEKDGFLPIPNVRLPADSEQQLGGKGAEERELACLKDCSCTAYAYESECSIWSRDIRNLQSLSEGDNRAGTLYLRLAASDLPKKTGEMKSIKRIVVSAAIAIVLSAAIIGLTLIFVRKRHGASKSPEGPLVSYSYSHLQRITKNFTEKLGGGGFGLVFKGLLSDSDFVAVKRLEGVRQGEKEFRNELGTLGRIQQRNLVRLRGFCCEGTERMLVYDYMPKGFTSVW